MSTTDLDTIPRSLLREAYEASSYQFGAKNGDLRVVTERMWPGCEEKTSEFLRLLGFRNVRGDLVDFKANRGIPYDVAVQVIRALDQDPVDYGL